MTAATTIFSHRDDAAAASVDALRAAYPQVRGHLDAATCGLPLLGTVVAMQRALQEWQDGAACAVRYGETVERARGLAARVLGVPTSWVATGSQTSVAVGTVAAGLPDGARVVVVEDDFTSVTYPFTQHADRGIEVVAVPLEGLADAVARGCDAVAFSLVASRTGHLADVDAVLEAAHDVGALTLADLTQAAGWLPVTAERFDVTVTSGYKWLSCPRGTAVTTVAPAARDHLRATSAGWYASESPWDGVYGTTPRLAPDARRFDVSPAWLAWVGAVPALEAYAAVDLAGVRDHDVALANAFRAGVDLPPGESAIISLPDPDGAARARLEAAGCRVAGRGGGVRLAFHVWSDAEDVELALASLGTGVI
ncbi:aminotransferase class V-fold PLP-dependent enzyme [Litorihabitans aurantiacus]|uniref:Aminotransferase class V n=1 Tax=Litorihabitans aurantiacus TaxID=1930061 RepID=A0AA37XDI2_9MICO|nr:aminotransferase class V-fold PLP-dependent enzyme [Litorihabitans aurantiacus]GMA31213.1 aminotransferase class V [Litorihabitans aurantiacus]